MAVERTPEEVARIIKEFISGEGGDWDWDDFCSIRIRDPELDNVRLRCVTLRDDYPPESSSAYCNEEGMRVLSDLVQQLRRVAI